MKRPSTNQSSGQNRPQRLAKALRINLKRRKDQERKQTAGPQPKMPKTHDPNGKRP